jgi:hypothetical protein
MTNADTGLSFPLERSLADQNELFKTYSAHSVVLLRELGVPKDPMLSITFRLQSQFVTTTEAIGSPPPPDCPPFDQL